MMPTSAHLAQLLAERSAKHGHFTLASGRTSDLYIDARLTTMSPDGLALIGTLGAALIAREFSAAESIGGLTLGADPIACAIAYHSASLPHPLRAFTVRKEPKGHGMGRQVEGPYHAGDAVVVVEDVITTGSSALKAIDVLLKHDARILGVLALVDREEGGREAIEQTGLRVCSLVTATDIRKLLA
jgi:orotate phosphoribosyltransferase